MEYALSERLLVSMVAWGIVLAFAGFGALVVYDLAQHFLAHP